MEPMSYGEMVAAHLADVRSQAARERRFGGRSRRGVIASWRVASGRLLVAAGERVAGCAELARADARPAIKILG